MKKIFSFKLYVEGLKRIKIAGIAAAIAVILLNAVIPIIAILENDVRFLSAGGYVSSVMPFEFMPVSLLMLVFGAVFAHAMFSFLNERNRSDFFHAIPHKRICVYLSFVAAIVTWIFGILIASAGVNAVLYGIAEYYAVNVSVIVITPLAFGLASTMIAAFMTLAMTLTGTTISNVLIFLLVLLFGRTIGQIFVTCLSELAPIISRGESFLNYLEFNFSLPFALLIGEGFGNTSLILYTVFVTLLVFAAGAVCYVRRKSETATKSAPSKLLQHVYRSAISLPFFLFVVLTMITNGMDMSTQLVLLILAILVYCIFELMTTKKIKSLVKALPMILIPILLSVVFTFAVYIARDAVLNQVPDIDDIEAVGMQDSVNYKPSYRDFRTNETFVESDEAKRIILNALKRDVEQIRNYGNFSFTILGENKENIDIYCKETFTFRLKNGRIFGRYLRLTEWEYERLMSIFLESFDYLGAYLDLPSSKEVDVVRVYSYNIKREDEKRLWASFVQEYNALSSKEQLAYTEASYRGVEVGRFIVSGTYRLKSFNSHYAILYEYMPKTAKMYLDMAAETGQLQQDMMTLEMMIDQLLKIDEGKNTETQFSLTASMLTGDEAGQEYYVESVKSETELPKEKAAEMLEFLVEHGEFSLEPTNTLIRFSITLYGVVLLDLDYDADSSYPSYSSLPYVEIAADAAEVMSTRLILALTDEEWEEFKALIEPYYYK